MSAPEPGYCAKLVESLRREANWAIGCETIAGEWGKNMALLGRKFAAAADELERQEKALAAADRLAHDTACTPLHRAYWELRGGEGACTVCTPNSTTTQTGD